MADRFLGLRHNAVVGRHDQDGDIGDVGPARPHFCKGFVPRRIDESDRLAVLFDLIGADVLGNAALFTRNHVNADNAVQKRRFSMVDVSEERNDWRTRLQQGRIVLAFIDLGKNLVLQGHLLAEIDFHAEFHRQQFGQLGIQLGTDVHGGCRAQSEQIAKHLGR